jgi:hypothetical protein
MALKGMFKEGFAPVREHVAEQAAKAEQRKKGYLGNFFLADNETKVVSLLTVEPLSYREHYLRDAAKGSQYQMCIEGAIDEMGREVSCPHCAAGNKAGFKGAFLIIDHSEDKWTDKDGKEQKRSNQLKVWKASTRALRSVDKLSEKRDLTKFSFEVTRLGSGPDTNYSILPEDLVKLNAETKKNITEFLDGMTPKDKLIDWLSPSSAAEVVEEEAKPYDVESEVREIE